MTNLDAEKYKALRDRRNHRFAPLIVVAAFDALLGGEDLKWCLPQNWEREGLTHWRVLGVTGSRLVCVSASSDVPEWEWDKDDLENPDRGSVSEAWTQPLSDVEALVCDSAGVSVRTWPTVQISTSPRYSVTLRTAGAPIPVSARPDATSDDAEAAAAFARLVLGRWR